MKQADQEKADARSRLLSLIKPGDVVTTVLLNVSPNGMHRRISLFVVSKNEMININRDCLILGHGHKPRNGNAGVGVGGCGSDMGYDLVYSLSRDLFQGGFVCIGKDCPSNDHSNGDRDYGKHTHRDGGYSLKHRWG